MSFRWNPHCYRILRTLAAALTVGFFDWSVSPAAEQAIRLLVESGSSARLDCPITVALPDEIAGRVRDWTLTEIRDAGRTPTPHQILAGKQARLAWLLTGETPANTLRTYELRPAAEPAEKAGATIKVHDDRKSLEIRRGDRPILRYHTARVAPPAGMDPKYGRSGYIHPVWTPAGAIVSDEFPPDHPHQDGIFLAYVKTEFQGRTPDFWNLLGGTGFVRSAGVAAIYEGPVCGGFRVRHEHVNRHGESEETVALVEEWDVCAWNGGADAPSWRFDITSRIDCAGDSPLAIREYHYGGMAFRAARTWVGDNVAMRTADGKEREAGNHTRTSWVDLSGKIGERPAGVTIFTDPGNFRFPEPVRLHPTMPYFVYTPAVSGDWSIEPGRTHVSRYHSQVRDGEFNPADAERLRLEISDPPRVALRVVSE